MRSGRVARVRGARAARVRSARVVLWSIAIMVVFAPLAVRKYRRIG
jgi:hypothetical protein